MMTFWLTTAILTALAAAALIRSILRGRQVSATTGDSLESDMRIYRDQLAEVERDMARGVLSPEEAERVRIEISRRLLDLDRRSKASADSTQEGAAARGVTARDLALAALIGLGLFGGAYYTYLHVGAPGMHDLPIARRLQLAEKTAAERPHQEALEARMPPWTPPADAAQEFLDLMEKLRAAVKKRPDDIQGHELLARNEAALGNFAAAWRAQKELIALKGDAATADDWVTMGEMMILAAGGIVSPEAESALRKGLELNPDNGPALYYIGLMQAQTGRPDLAFETWRNLMERSRPGAPWLKPIREQIETVAQEAGIRYSLPPEPTPQATAPGPDAQDLAAAQDMTPEQRQQMIRSMVSRLDERLAQSGGSVEEWSRLIKALAVLGEKDKAASRYRQARAAYADDEAASAQLAEAARKAGIAP